MLKVISWETHRFYRGKAAADGTCLFWSILKVLKSQLLQTIGEDLFRSISANNWNEDLRTNVASHIRNHAELHELVLNSGTKWTTIEKYCSELEQGKLYAGDIELGVLSDLYNIIICKIFMTKEMSVWSWHYGVGNPAATKCVYILYDEAKEHFEPLYVGNMQNLNEKKTIFDPNDDIVNDLLRKFIKEDLKLNGDVKLGVGANGKGPIDGSKEGEQMTNSILLNIPLKRKEPDIDNIVSPPNNDKQVPLLISKKHYDVNKRVKTDKIASDEMSTYYEKHSESMTIEKLLQTDFSADQSISPPIQKPKTDIPTVPKKEKTESEIKRVKERNDGVGEDDKVECNTKSSQAEPSF